jgi:hypothetical protein
LAGKIVASVGPPQILRCAAVWGTTVLVLQTLRRGESFEFGDLPPAVLPIPDGLEMAAAPLRAVPGGWLLDARGAIGGLLTLRGRDEDPRAIAASGATVAVMPGDYGIVQYGLFSVFFQYVAQPKIPKRVQAPDALGVVSLAASVFFHLGFLAMLQTIGSPGVLEKPFELSPPKELAARFGLHRSVQTDAKIEQTSKPVASASTADLDPRVHPSQNKQAPLSPSDSKQDTPISNSHGYTMLEVLDGDAGKEVQLALGSIRSFGQALSGANPKAPRHAPLETKVAVAAGAVLASGGLSREQIRRVLSSRTEALGACFEGESQRSWSPQGGVTVQWQIDSKGSVVADSVVSSSLNNPRIEACIVRQVRGWKFPSAETSTNVASFPISFAVRN